MKRFACIWFPQWPLERLRRARQATARRQGLSSNTTSPAPDEASRRGAQPTPPSRSRPFVLTESGRHGLVVAAANRTAREAGIGPGLGFTDACARIGDPQGLAFEEIDRIADMRALKRLARWMVRFSPLVALDGIDGLMLEVTGCAHLFGGEDAMARAMTERLNAAGHSARIAIAATPGAAWAVAHMGAGPVTVLPDGEERTGLADLPVAALRLSPAADTLLRRFGLTRISQLYGLDRKALARRFSSRETADMVTLRLDQALGLRAEPLTPERAPPDFWARLACPAPIAATEGVTIGLETLAADLCKQLDTHGLGARDFLLTAFRADGGLSSLEVSAARPVRDNRHVLRLFSEKIETIDPGFGIDLMTLAADRTDPVSIASAPLSAELGGGGADLDALARLADRLAARLGEAAVNIAAPNASHIPERAEAQTAFAGDLAAPAQPHAAGPRPLRLLDPPEAVEVIAEVPDGPPQRFIWRRVPRRAVKADGPERIAPEWWRIPHEGKRARDYYRVEDIEGRRYWLFREGLYDDNRGGPPRWFMHGLFA